MVVSSASSLKSSGETLTHIYQYIPKVLDNRGILTAKSYNRQVRTGEIRSIISELKSWVTLVF